MAYGGHGRYSGSSYGGSHCHVPRSWSSESSSAGPALPLEMDMYSDDDEDAGIHSESYRSSSWIYISDSDELAVWKQHSGLPKGKSIHWLCINWVIEFDPLHALLRALQWARMSRKAPINRHFRKFVLMVASYRHGSLKENFKLRVACEEYQLHRHQQSSLGNRKDLLTS
ncbi:uncharacterized protein CEXT_244141 [Caerostris extrusa]|uniref:Uncharacterized protein n=1 Tax=Caerostris extrusa TaxID=172846 RepID=A0AAV4PW02_CAEEX|nr:uncharacterized protein CEXT_244141 [Caerostris extrusa]